MQFTNGCYILRIKMQKEKTPLSPGTEKVVVFDFYWPKQLHFMSWDIDYTTMIFYVQEEVLL
ncbi:hypothetical protein THMA_0965 [Thermotoga maritima MSB8]|nr:hypothetical protein THEMA_09635 [Thermotoga maritima MSB8]AKE26855.1 hypothetical protein THMC_0965 [Thermotoga maritima]AKE28720.1 hypothetical protein THMA_0965 [Thermotoga maritima MSB8]AKE30593.1 hypothetical protein THMB_0965 [Thermotoga maritima]